MDALEMDALERMPWNGCPGMDALEMDALEMDALESDAREWMPGHRVLRGDSTVGDGDRGGLSRPDHGARRGVVGNRQMW
jgi:hypothetical protein